MRAVAVVRPQLSLTRKIHASWSRDAVPRREPRSRLWLPREFCHSGRSGFDSDVYHLVFRAARRPLADQEIHSARATLICSQPAPHLVGVRGRHPRLAQDAAAEIHSYQERKKVESYSTSAFSKHFLMEMLFQQVLVVVMIVLKPNLIMKKL